MQLYQIIYLILVSGATASEVQGLWYVVKYLYDRLVLLKVNCADYNKWGPPSWPAYDLECNVLSSPPKANAWKTFIRYYYKDILIAAAWLMLIILLIVGRIVAYGAIFIWHVNVVYTFLSIAGTSAFSVSVWIWRTLKQENKE